MCELSEPDILHSDWFYLIREMFFHDLLFNYLLRRD